MRLVNASSALPTKAKAESFLVLLSLARRPTSPPRRVVSNSEELRAAEVDRSTLAGNAVHPVNQTAVTSHRKNTP